MKIALIARAPVFGGWVRAFDDKEARGIAGVIDVFEIPPVQGTAVAVVADRFWPAKQACSRLKIDWDLSGIEHAEERLSVPRHELSLMACWRTMHPRRPLAQTLRWTGNRETPYHCDGIFAPRSWRPLLVRCEVIRDPRGTS